MKIEALNKKSWIEIRRNAENDWPSFHVEASLDIGNSFFKAANHDLLFLNLLEFSGSFTEFVLNRSLTPRLEGTYETLLSFRAEGRAVFIDLTLGSSSVGVTKKISYSLVGGFEVAEESLLIIESGFKELVQNA